MSDTSSASSAAVPTNPYQTNQGSAPLVGVGQNAVQAINNLADGFGNAFPVANASTSPITTPINSLTTTAAVVLAANTSRHGLVFHNPSTTVSVYVFQTNATPAPTLAAPGGAFILLPCESLTFPAIAFSNLNAGFSAFSGTGTSQPLTILEFR